MFLNTTAFDTNRSPIPVNSMSQSSRSCSALQMGFFGFVSTVGISCSKASSSSASARGSPPTGSMSSPMGTVSRFTVVVGLTSGALCHTRFPTVGSLSQKFCSASLTHTVGFFRLHFPVQVEIGSIFLETNWNKLVFSKFIQQFLEMNSFPDQFFCESESYEHRCASHRSLLVVLYPRSLQLLMVVLTQRLMRRCSNLRMHP